MEITSPREAVDRVLQWAVFMKLASFFISAGDAPLAR